MRYAVLNLDGDIINMIEYDGIADYTPPTNCTIRQATDDDVFNG